MNMIVDFVTQARVGLGTTKGLHFQYNTTSELLLLLLPRLHRYMYVFIFYFHSSGATINHHDPCGPTLRTKPSPLIFIASLKVKNGTPPSPR
jgi:hypothetical protein